MHYQAPLQGHSESPYKQITYDSTQFPYRFPLWIPKANGPFLSTLLLPRVSGAHGIFQAAFQH